MKPRIFLLSLVLVLLAAGLAGGAYLWWINTDASSSVGTERTERHGPLIDARDSLLNAPREVGLDLSVDIPKGSESDKPDHQEISAQGSVDFATREAQLVYDFNGLANAAGNLGHFDTMDVIYADGVGYLDVFIDGPPWVSFEPTDASNADVARLRELMLTTPMLLPGLLEATATAPAKTENERFLEVDPAALTESDDPFAAGLGDAFEELDVDALRVLATVGEDGLTALELLFEYQAAEGETTVEVTYTIGVAESEISVEAPDESEVRAFSSILT